MTKNRYPGLSDENAARIVAREPYESVQSRAYVRADGVYIIGSGALMNDDDQTRDLFAVYPDDRIELLSPLANPEMIARILADARAEAPSTWLHSRKGRITGWITRHDGEWVDIRLSGDHELRYMSTMADPHHDDGERITVRASFLTPTPKPEEAKA
jgi:hypothetical protein